MAEQQRSRPKDSRRLRVLAGQDQSFSDLLDPLIHDRIRLGIMSALAAAGSTSFAEMKRLLGTSDGNLSVHARKLEEAGLIEVHKSFAGRVPHTEYQLTERGRKALERHLDHLEALIRAVRKP